MSSSAGDGRRESRIDLDETATIRHARAFVAECLPDDYADEVRGTVLLLASELVTNAYLHGRPPRSLAVRTDDTCIRVEVADAAPALPLAAPTRAPGEGGLGILIVQRASSAWGVDQHAQGKVVWFEVRGTSGPGGQARGG